MFNKLRTHFILINLITTSIILASAFSTVYLVAKNTSEARRPIDVNINLNESGITTEFQPANDATDPQSAYVRKIVEERILADRELSLRSLLITLIVTGLAVEIIVAVFSYYFADQAIKPVKEAYESQKIFIANASHEIKTPVAAIKANLEAADLSDENHWIKNIELEADKIETLNLALLRLAKTDIMQEAIVTEDVDLERLVKAVTNSFSSRLEQKGINLKTDSDFKKGQKTIKINRADFKEIFEILFDNAIKYCKKSIEIKISPHSLLIKNDGATIPKEKLPRIFDRFYQVDKSSNGSGLGLAIAMSLAKHNNWNIEAKSENKITSFELKF